MPKAWLQHFARIKDSDFAMGSIDYIVYLGSDTLRKIPPNPENQGERTNRFDGEPRNFLNGVVGEVDTDYPTNYDH